MVLQRDGAVGYCHRAAALLWTASEAAKSGRILPRAAELLRSVGGAAEYCCRRQQSELHRSRPPLVEYRHHRACRSTGLNTTNPTLQVWTIFLKKTGIKHNKRALLTLLMWCENYKLNVPEGNALELKTWERAGRDTVATASISDDTAINIIKPWRLIMDIRTVREWESKTDREFTTGATN